MDETVHLRDERNVPTARHVLRAFFAVPAPSRQEVLSATPEEDAAEEEAAQIICYGLIPLKFRPVC